MIEIVFALYILMLGCIGYYAWRRTKGIGDYVLGGRRLGGLAIGLSAFASGMSAWLLQGLPGDGYRAGLEHTWLVGGLVVGMVANWYFVAGPLRRYSELAGDSLTLPSFFSARFADKSGVLRIFTALIILAFFTFYITAQLVGGGKLFHLVFGYDYQLAVLAGATLVLCYTMVGGFLAVSWTDVLQGLLMLFAVVLTPVIAFSGSNIPATLKEMDPALLNPFTNSSGQNLGFIALVSALGWGLGYFGQPHILARFKAIRSLAALPLARRIAISAAIVAMSCAVLAGLVGRAVLGPDLADPETVLMELINALFHPLLAGILLAGILAAIMSTVDSMLLVSSAAVAEDIAGRTFGLGARTRLRLGRGAVLAIGLVATWMALDGHNSVLSLVAYAWAGLGAAFGPPVLLSLYWRRCNGYGALAGVLTGGAIVFLWRQASGGLFDLYELVPGFFLSLAATWLVSLLTSPPSSETQALFDQARGRQATPGT